MPGYRARRRLLGAAITLVAASVANGAGGHALTFGRSNLLPTDQAFQPNSDNLPSTATDGAGSWLTVWTSHGRIVASRSTDGGRTWSAPVVVAPDGRSQQVPRLATDRHGVWVVTWMARYAAESTWDVFAARSTDVGATWTTAPALDGADGTLDDLWPRIATDAAGTWVVTWQEQQQSIFGYGDRDIAFARSVDGGTSWSAAALIDPGAATDMSTDEFPTLATDGTTWLAAWYAFQPPGDPEIAFARSFDGGATWTVPTTLNADAPTDSRIDRDPDVATDGQGTWIAVWSDNGGQTQIARSADAGTTWTMPAALDLTGSTDGHQGFFPHVASAGDGHWVASWDAIGGTLGDDGDVLFAQTDDDGSTWTAPRPLNSSALGDVVPHQERDTSLATDGAGHWVATWSAYPDGVAVARNVVGCEPGPRAGCRTAPSKAARMKVLSAPSKLAWIWRRGEAVGLAELGQPTDDDEYAVCLYDESGPPTLVLEAVAPPGGVCQRGRDACWRALSSTGFNYRDLTASPQGVDRLVLKSGAAGKSAVKMHGRGSLLQTTTMPLDLPLRMQLQATTGTCWEATYSTPKRNDGRAFIASSD